MEIAKIQGFVDERFVLFDASDSTLEKIDMKMTFWGTVVLSWKSSVRREKVRDGSLLYSSLKLVRKLLVKLPNVVVSFNI